MYSETSEKLQKAGFISLSATLFLISFPRSWSLYPLGLFLFTGLILWVSDFHNNYLHLKKHFLLLLPPVSYFIIHLINVLVQQGPINLLEDRLMFILIPIFGFPFFIRHSSEDDKNFFKVFIAGIVFVSVILIFRIIIFVHNLVPDNMSFFEYSRLHKYWYFSAHVSVFENPTYFSMKIMWVLLLIIFYNNKLKIRLRYIILISTGLSVFLFFLASRASILFWIITAVFFLFRLTGKRIIKPFLLACIIPALLILTGILVEKIPRINESITDIRVKVFQKEIDWKNIDQRTREWYTAYQVIKEKPLTGIGMKNLKERMKNEYLKHGFEEEAKSIFNAHNQYLEAQMTFGLAGTISLLWMLLTPLFLKRVSEHPEMVIAFVVMISFYLMFESMFNRQWGIMFFMLFYFILSTQKKIIQSNP
jgi:O-antigen ligase